MIRTADRDEAEHYMRSGARLKRLAHDMALDLSIQTDLATPDARHGLDLMPLSDVDALAAASATSIPPGHPDHGFWSTPTDQLEYWRYSGTRS